MDYEQKMEAHKTRCRLHALGRMFAQTDLQLSGEAVAARKAMMSFAFVITLFSLSFRDGANFSVGGLSGPVGDPIWIVMLFFMIIVYHGIVFLSRVDFDCWKRFNYESSKFLNFRNDMLGHYVIDQLLGVQCNVATYDLSSSSTYSSSFVPVGSRFLGGMHDPKIDQLCNASVGFRKLSDSEVLFYAEADEHDLKAFHFYRRLIRVVNFKFLMEVVIPSLFGVASVVFSFWLLAD